MADENTPEDVQEDGKKSKKKLLIIVAIVGVLAIVLSLVVTMFLLPDEESTPVEEVVKGGKEPATYYDIKQPFLVTFNVEGRQRYMQVSLTIVSRQAAFVNTLDHHLPLVISRLNSAFSSASFNELKTEAGKLALQETSLKVINDMLESEGVEPVENVYFTNFVLQ